MATQPHRPPPTPPHVQPPPPRPPAPQPPARPEPPPARPEGGRAAADPQAAKLELARVDAPVFQSDRTIADEQRERSDEIAAMGVEKYKQSIDQRRPEDRPKQVAGVSNLEPRDDDRPREHERDETHDRTHEPPDKPRESEPARR